MKNCAVPACERKANGGKGLCKSHYYRLKVYGNPLAGYFRVRKPGEGTITQYGYIAERRDGITKQQHIRIVEKVLGHALPRGARIHHVDGNGLNNAHTNLVVCPNDAYHKLLHVRARALDVTGHADWHKCQFCQQWDAPQNLAPARKVKYHLACRAADARARRSFNG